MAILCLFTGIGDSSMTVAALPPFKISLNLRQKESLYAMEVSTLTVPMQFTVGINTGGRTSHVSVEAEDALIAALKVKAENPSARITYVRRSNRRGDARHPPAVIAQH
jgi:hypothetical protein